MSIDAVIEEKDKDFSIYEVPLSLVDNKLDKLIVDKLGLKTAEPESRRLARAAAPAAQSRARNQHRRRRQVRRAPRRLQVDLRSARPRRHRPSGPGSHRPHPQRRHRSAKAPSGCCRGYDGILVPGGFGERGIEGKVEAIRYARRTGIPFFGICLGMQCAVIEFARNVCSLERRPLDRVRQARRHPVICLLDEQKTITDKGGTMRLGAQPTRLEPDSLAAQCYGTTEISERHRHRYEFNNNYRQQFAAHGLRFSGTSPDGSLVEVIELPEHPVVPGRAVPSRIQIEADRAAAAVRRLHRRGRGKQHRQQSRASRPVPAPNDRAPPRRRSRQLPAELLPSDKKRRRMPDEKKLIIDEDWKSQVEAEKQAAKQPARPQATAGAESTARPATPTISRCRPLRSRCSFRRSSPKR